MPCAVPLAWRVARVDDAFGIDDREATSVLEQAAGLWEDATGARLFTLDPDEGFPVRFVYDERQARTEERMRRESELLASGRELENRGAELAAEGDRVREEQARHQETLTEYESRVSAYNARVRSWNERGGAPADVQRRLSDEGEALADERRDLEGATRSLTERGRALTSEQERLNRDVAEHNRRSTEVATAFPPTPVESGVYREAVRTQDGQVLSVSREIRIYRFGDIDELRLVAAHELGHALGLGHSDVASAVMNEAHGEGIGGGTIRRVHSADVELLRAVCPDLPVRGGL